MRRLRMFDALLPYFGNKRKLCPVIFSHIAKHLPRQDWQSKVFVDAFLGSSAVSLFAKAQGFKVIAHVQVHDGHPSFERASQHPLCSRNARPQEPGYYPALYPGHHLRPQRSPPAMPSEGAGSYTNIVWELIPENCLANGNTKKYNDVNKGKP